MNGPKALDCAVRYLAKAARSRSEVEGFLTSRGFDHETVLATIQELLRLDYINDERLAADLAQRLFQKGFGRGKVAESLASRGISPLDVEAALGPRIEEDEVASALEILAKRKVTLADLPKSARFLTSRGFSEEVVQKAIATAFPADFD